MEVLGRYSKLDRFQKRLDRLEKALVTAPNRSDPTTETWQPHALNRRLTADQQSQLITDYQAGDGCTVLSRRYGISENGALDHLRRHGVTLRPPGKVTTDRSTRCTASARPAGTTKRLATATASLTAP